MPSARPRAGGVKPQPLFQPPPGAQPLAARMRPRSLDEYVGQAHLVGERGPLRRSVARGHLASLLLWGPPGTGKTSLARLLADAVGADFGTISAVMSGVAEGRAQIAEAQGQLALKGAGPRQLEQPPVQQGRAGRAAAARRGRDGHAHRGHDRESGFRVTVSRPMKAGDQVGRWTLQALISDEGGNADVWRATDADGVEV